MRLDWNIISAISDSLAAVAVVVSLLYLARQIRDGSASASATTHYEITQALNNVFFDIAKDPSLSEIFHKGNRNPEELTNEEIPRYMTMVGVIFSIFNNLHLQYEKGTLVEESWESALSSMEHLVKNNGVRYWWQYNRTHYRPGFCAILEQKLADNME